jgi:hypothetical protein
MPKTIMIFLGITLRSSSGMPSMLLYPAGWLMMNLNIREMRKRRI